MVRLVFKNRSFTEGREEAGDAVLILDEATQSGKLEYSPDAVVIIDMVADDDLIIYKEKNSSTHITNQLWEIAARLGYDDIFNDEEKYSIIDDHLPFINKGINAALIIDMDYPYWHTNSDILENTSPDSLEIVGSVLLDYINSFTPND